MIRLRHGRKPQKKICIKKTFIIHTLCFPQYLKQYVITRNIPSEEKSSLTEKPLGIFLEDCCDFQYFHVPCYYNNIKARVKLCGKYSA